MKVFKLIVSSLKNTKLYIVLFFILSFILNYFTTYIPVVIKYFIDRVLNQNTNNILLDKIVNLLDKNISYIISICVILVVVQIVVIISTYLRSVIKSKIVQEFQHFLKFKLFDHIQGLTYQEFYSKSLADLVQNLGDDVDNIVKFIDTQITYILDIVLIIVFAIVQLINIDFRLSTVMVLLSIVIIISSVLYYRKSRDVIEKIIDMKKKLYSKMNDNFENINFVKINNLQRKEIKEFEDIVSESNKYHKEKIEIDINYKMVVENVVKLGAPLIFILSSLLYMTKSITIGAIYVTLSYSNKVTKYFTDIAEIIESFNLFRESAERVNDLLILTTEENSSRGSISVKKRTIKFENVNIYVNCVCILENLNFTIQKDEKVIVVGQTGSRKTILLKTLIGFYEYTGSIKIGEYELRDLNKNDIRENVCMLLQDSYLFSKTISENIKILTPYMSYENMVDISKFFAFDEEVKKLKDGYNSKVGKKGVTLSKGQRQRLVLVRAFTKPKPIMIFDDSFSAIDRINKKRILDNLLKMENSFTKIVISHDIGLVKRFDKIIFLNNKHAIFGSYEDLLKNEDFMKIYNLNQDKIEEDYI